MSFMSIGTHFFEWTLPEFLIISIIILVIVSSRQLASGVTTSFYLKTEKDVATPKANSLLNTINKKAVYIL